MGRLLRQNGHWGFPVSLMAAKRGAMKRRWISYGKDNGRD